MSAEVTQHLDHTHSEAITNIVKSIQSDRLKMLVKDLSDFKVEYSEENLIIYCKETLKTICPNVIQHEDIVDRLTEGLSRDILQSEINRSTKPPPTPAPPISSNPLESHHDFLDEMREMRAEIKALQAQIGKTKTSTNKSNPRKPSPTPGKSSKAKTPESSDNEDHTYTTVRYGRSKSPKNVDRVGKGPQKTSTRISTGSGSMESREVSPSARTTRQSRSLQKGRNSRSASPSNDPTIARRSQDGGKKGKGKGKHLY
jgi:hypothetical protein